LGAKKEKCFRQQHLGMFGKRETQACQAAGTGPVLALSVAATRRVKEHWYKKHLKVVYTRGGRGPTKDKPFFVSTPTKTAETQKHRRNKKETYKWGKSVGSGVVDWGTANGVLLKRGAADRSSPRKTGEKPDPEKARSQRW